eukprot:COSAG01_NODE_702_length_14141_cov_36.742739_2_plen_50_part_00
MIVFYSNSFFLGFFLIGLAKPYLYILHVALFYSLKALHSSDSGRLLKPA